MEKNKSQERSQDKKLWINSTSPSLISHIFTMSFIQYHQIIYTSSSFKEIIIIFSMKKHFKIKNKSLLIKYVRTRRILWKNSSIFMCHVSKIFLYDRKRKVRFY